ncbi:MAG TPA: cytochrome c [Steroidobacteraceae bacterium]|jgi:mono/diheme cytochrome c family protein
MSARKPHPGWLGAGVAIWLLLAAAALVDTPAQAGSAGIFDPSTLTTTDGRQIFEHICQGCHMQGGRGAVGAGHFPALANNRTLASRQYMALTILTGRRNMPAFGARHAIGFVGPPPTLSEAQIAAVINYVRTHFGNRYTDSITASEVAAIDQSLR